MDDDTDQARSRARDHLANERTYLAWLRSAANVMVLGLAVAKFGPASNYGLAAGLVLIAVAIGGLGYGTLRYRRVNGEIEEGRYATGSRGRGPVVSSVVLVAAVLAALALLSLAGGG